MTKRHKWEWAKGYGAGVKQCVNCGMVKFPGHVFRLSIFFMGRKQVAEGKTPPCDPASVILGRTLKK